MRDYIAEQVSLKFIWSFDRMLPAVPGPGTIAFAGLCKDLHPYGLDASAVTVDTPTIRLGDVIVRIGLLDNTRLIIRLSVASIEFDLTNLYEGDEEILTKIVDALFKASHQIDEDAMKGKAEVKCASHLTLSPGENHKFMSEFMGSDLPANNLIPEAAKYKVEPTEGMIAETLSILFAESVINVDAVFVEVTANYASIVDTVTFANDVASDIYAARELIGLHESEAGS